LIEKESKVTGAKNAFRTDAGIEIIKHEARSDKKPVSVLFVHGLYHGAWAFKDTLLPFFAGHGYDAFALSWQGHGNSSGRELVKKARMDDYYQDLCHAIKSVGQPVVLIGHSLGGMLVQKYLESHSSAGAVFVCTPSAKDMKAAAITLLKTFPWPMLKFIFTSNPDHLYHRKDFSSQVLFGGDPSPTAEKVFQQLMKQPESNKVIKDSLAFKPGAPSQRIPTLIIGGQADGSILPGSYDECAQIYSGEVKLYPAKPHELLFIPGWETIASDIVNWMNRAVKV
jgi:alpha-beta hydrolase superfamily lysophospholipase